MKTIFFVTFLTGLVSCVNYNSTNNQDLEKSNQAIEKSTDSLKWLFYAYSYNGTALFIRGNESFSSKPIECDVRVDTIFKLNNDTLKVILSFYKKGYRYSHIYEGLDLHGFLYFNGVAKPLTGMVVYNEFEDSKTLKNNNQRTDSMFKLYLKTTDKSTISKWLLRKGEQKSIW